MPLFVMIGRDGPDGPALRNQHREGHQLHLKQLIENETIVYAGPIRDEADQQSVGAVIVLRADTLAAARAIVDRDPYVIGGVFATLQVDPFKQVIPDPA